MLDLSRIESAGVVAQIEHHAEIASTNDRAVQLAGREDLQLPLLVVAERQTAGRGRGREPLVVCCGCADVLALA